MQSKKSIGDLNDIYQRYARAVYKFLLAKTHSEDLAQELTQETFFQAVRSIERFDGSCKLSTWLCAIARNQWLAYQREHPVQESIEDLPKDLSAYRMRNAAQAGQSAEDELFQAEHRVELMKKLHLCPEPYREILYLRIFGVLSFKEIGEIMGRTENWARVNYYRGKERLRKEIEDDE